MQLIPKHENMNANFNGEFFNTKRKYYILELYIKIIQNKAPKGLLLLPLT